MDKQIDLSFFESVSPSSASSCSTNEDISSCNPIQRLLTSLSYYNKLIPTNNDENGKTIFSNFMYEFYGCLVYDDFHHLLKDHQKDIKLIMDLTINQYQIPKCKLSECKNSDRHFRINDDNDDIQNNDDGNDNLKYFKIQKETMDTLHFYIFHLFDGGLRCLDIDEKAHETNNNSPYFDPLFQKMSAFIEKSKEKTKRFKRLNGNKFNISAVNDIDSDKKDEKETDDKETFLDFLCSTIESKRKELGVFLWNILYKNGYDTDSLDLDASIYKKSGDSNIYMLCKDDDNNTNLIMTEMMKILDKFKSFVAFYCVPLHCLA